MKNRIIYIGFLLITLGLSSCFLDESGELAEEAQISAASIEVPADQVFILGLTENLSMNFELAGLSKAEEIASVDVMKSFNGEIGTSSETLFKTVSTIPDSISFTLDELLANTGYEQDQLNGGDRWTLTYKVMLADGRTLTAGSSDVVFSCLSDIPEVTYTGVAEGFDAVLEKSGIQIANLGEGNYSISDISAGLLGALIEDPTYEGGGSFTDVCNTLTVNTYNPPGLVEVTQSAALGPGSYDPSTGVFILNWTIVGTDVKVTFTPEN